jgi:four helix bundle protein|tara:strand:+ start:159 stop:533 length:375 start_codon:yes stop_codon:yes gene_type:complete
MISKEIQILPKIYDMILWYSPKISQYPKKYKYTIGERITNTQLAILERIIEAKYTSSNKKKHFLRQANLNLEKLRFLVRLSKDLQCISIKEFEFISKNINEIGQMIGGWEKWSKQNGQETQTSL